MVVEDSGRVQEIIDSQTALIIVTSHGECTSCAAKDSCNIFGTKNDHPIKVRYSGDLKIGDEVKIIFKPQNRIVASIVIFFLPVIVLLASYFFVFHFLKNEDFAILASIGSLLFSFIFIFFIAKSKMFKKFIPFVVKR